MLEQDKSSSNSNTQTWLAVIGLVGALGGAVISNWDKIFPRPTAYLAAPAPVVPVAVTVPSPSPEIKKDPLPEPQREVPASPQQQLPSVGPSFDCVKATYRSERLICSSLELAVLDLAMSNAYRDAAARLGPKGGKLALRNLQNHWLRTVRETCFDVSCLREIYKQRISELNAYSPSFSVN